MREASVVVAREVMKAARRDGVSELPDSLWAEWEEWGDVALTTFIKQRIYDPACFSDPGRHLCVTCSQEHKGPSMLRKEKESHL